MVDDDGIGQVPGPDLPLAPTDSQGSDGGSKPPGEPDGVEATTERHPPALTAEPELGGHRLGADSPTPPTTEQKVPKKRGRLILLPPPRPRTPREALRVQLDVLAILMLLMAVIMLIEVTF